LERRIYPDETALNVAMSRLGSFAVLVTLLGVTVATGTIPPHQQSSYAIRVGRILDPRTGQYSAPSVIVVSGGKVRRVVRADSYSGGSSDSLIDLSGMTALPGLIDAHVHLAIGGPVRDNALADLRAGFTTVVDLGARTHRLLQIRDSINSGFIEGPRVFAAGIWVGAKGGVCEFNGVGIEGTPERFRERVRENVSGGADVIKLCVTSWPAQSFAEPMKFEVSPEVLAAAVEEAHNARKKAIAHAISLGGAQAAVRAGVDGLAHAAYVDSATAVLMRERGAFMIPTLASLTGGDTSQVGRALFAAVGRAYRAGVRLVFGTDGGVLPHGRNAEELLAMVQAGVSPLDAIKAATVNAAAAFGLADSLGTIAPGMGADLVVVDGDPLRDLSTLGRPRFVLARGRIVRSP
jgi:imidazolonepropionase-like amidohydrolase